MPSTVVIQTSFLGDMVLTTPLIAELARRGPVDVVATPANAPLLANNPDVRDVIVFDKRGAARGVRGLWRTARMLRARRPAVAYMAQGSLRSAALARLAAIPERVGFQSSAGRRLYTRAIPYRDDLHHAERLWQLAAPADAGATPERLRPHLYPSAAERAEVDAALAGSPLPGRPFVVLAPGSAWQTKRWPYYAELAQLLSADFGIAIVGGPADAEAGRRVAAAAGPRAVDTTGRLSLLASAELIGRGAALITNDSAPLHLGSAMGTPTVAVFGPTVPEFGFGPLAARARVMGHDALACRPCDRHGPPRCPLTHWRCMRDIGPDAVARAVRDIIANPSP